MRYSTILTVLLAASLLGGCCALHCNCKSCPKKTVVKNPVLDAPTAVQTPPNDSVETPVVAEKPDLRWIEWSVAGAAVAAGLVMAFVNKKRITNPKTKP